MENQINTSKTLLTFLVGGAIGASAALIVSKACNMRQAGAGRSQDGQTPATPYCAVPEGADICFPE
jgi:hypothetical protein